MSRKGLYYLKHVSLSGDENIIRLEDEDGKIKKSFPLSTIDAITTDFDNMKSLLEFISEKNKPKKNSNFDITDGYLYIEYHHNNKVKILNIVFSDNEEIREVSKKCKGGYKIKKDSKLTSLAYKLINIRKNETDIYNYLRNNYYVNSYLTNIINSYLFNTSDNYQNLSEAIKYKAELINKLTEYKTFRDISFGINNYYKQKNNHEIQKLKAIKDSIIENFYSEFDDNKDLNSEKVKKILPPKGAQLKFSDIGFDI